MENSLSLNKRNYDYPLIMPQSSRETSELSEPTYSTEHRTHQSGNLICNSNINSTLLYFIKNIFRIIRRIAYVTNVHAMEQCKDSYNEEKQYLQSNQNIIHATTMQQSPQVMSQSLTSCLMTSLIDDIRSKIFKITLK